MKKLRVQIIGPSGPCGKTTLQIAFKEWLESKGATVGISEDNYGAHQLKVISDAHAGASELDMKNLHVIIDVISI